MRDPTLLPDLPAADAIVALAAALGWELPDRTRNGAPIPLHPIAALAVATRTAMEAGRLGAAMNPLSELLNRVPRWRGAWRMASEVYAALGDEDSADLCRARAAGDDGATLLAS